MPRKRSEGSEKAQTSDLREPADHGSDHSDDEGNSSASSESDGGEGTPRFYNTTFSTFRVSPLYVGDDPLDTARLETLSRRLRDTLVGDVVRGVQVGLGLDGGDSSLGRTGALERVQWQWRSVQSILAVPKRTRSRGRGQEQKRALCLNLEYENVTFSAILLPPLDDNDNIENGIPWTWWNRQAANGSGTAPDGKDEAFAHLPLLLTRMPAPLKSVIAEYLSSTFDCRVSPMNIGTRTLIRSWERWVASASSLGIPLTKDVALTLGFHIEPPTDYDKKQAAGSVTRQPVSLGLKTIDVVIPADEVRRFVRAGGNSSNDRGESRRGEEWTGTAARRRELAGGQDEEGWAWRHGGTNDQWRQGGEGGGETIQQPFTEALAHYLHQHLALNMFHPGVRVLRVSCDAFALSEGRVKVFAPPRRPTDDEGSDISVVETFMRDLIRHARGREWSSSALRLADLGTTGG